MARIKAGDEVTWEASQGTVRGTVARKLTSASRIKGHRVAASPANPEYLVVSDQTGAKAAHKPEALTRVKAAKPDPDVDVAAAFREVVNMTPAAIAKWLESPESSKVGQKKDGKGESVGHRSGRRIIAILKRKAKDRDAADLAHMKKVVSYVRRHLAQRPEGDVSQTPWRYSLMNWGHDPLK